MRAQNSGSDAGVEAVRQYRESFNSFWDKLLILAEKHQDFRTVPLLVLLAKQAFFSNPSTYTDEETGWTYPSDIVEAIQLVVVGTDLLGDQQAFGLLINEIECLGSTTPITPEWQTIEAQTYGDALRMVAMRYLMELLKADAEVLKLQLQRFKEAQEKNEAAGLIGIPPERPELDVHYRRLWQQLQDYWSHMAGGL